MELTKQIAKTPAHEEKTLSDLLRKFTVFDWYLVLCHVLVIGYYAYHYNHIKDDGYWNDAASYSQLVEADSTITWHAYAVYLFWVPTDTPGENPHQVVEESDSLSAAGWMGIGVLCMMFSIWVTLIVGYANSCGVKRRTCIIALIVLSLWLLYETIKVHPYLS